MIRNYKSQDLDKISQLWLKTNISAHDFIPKTYWESQFDDVKKMLPEATLYIYEKDLQIVGFMGVMSTYIAGIFVDKDFQSKGIGKQLLNHAKEHHKELTLGVYQKNTKALNFYLREGFEVISESLDPDTQELEYTMLWKK